MEKDVETDKKCLKCGYEWRSRTKNPTECASCRTRKWNIPQDTAKEILPINNMVEEVEGKPKEFKKVEVI